MKDLAEETEKNKDDVAHLTLLRQHYEEREKTYAVSSGLVFKKSLKADERLLPGSASGCSSGCERSGR